VYLSVPLLELSADRELPGNLHLCIRHKIIRYKNKGDKLNAEAFNKLVYNQVKVVFIEEADREGYDAWLGENNNTEQVDRLKAENTEAAPIIDASIEQRRAMMDIFESPRDDRQVQAAVEASKKVVMEFMRKPFAVNNIQALQRYSKGCVDHSVNVSMLSVFLGLRMGYSHQLILENLALGGLFHDIGKVLIEKKDDAMTSDEDPAMQQHPKLGAELLVGKDKEVANEVRMIVAQHHEFLDGSGYPNKLKGLAIYDLARLVGIANIYDNLVSKAPGDEMKEKATYAIDQLEKGYEGKLDPKKLEKVVKILRYSFL
jgi:putative nucleotidyltransferase with HDIG domain